MTSLQMQELEVARAPVPPDSLSRDALLQKIKECATGFVFRPEIYRRRPAGAPDLASELQVTVPDWIDLRRRRELESLQNYGNPSTDRTATSLRPLVKSMKTHKAKGNGRTYTSRYRGVHQTFPTRRWEAQFRRNGKPTSLGCFDQEEEAARAYDKMMLWCELHNAVGVKGGITNFDPTQYDADVHWLQKVSQDELVQILRSDGRRQAAARTMKQKKEPAAGGPQTGPAAAAAAQAAAAAAAAAQAMGMGIVQFSEHSLAGLEASLNG